MSLYLFTITYATIHECNLFIYICKYCYLLYLNDKIVHHRNFSHPFLPTFHSRRRAWSTPEIAFKCARAPTPTKLLLRPPGRCYRPVPSNGPT